MLSTKKWLCIILLFSSTVDAQDVVNLNSLNQQQFISRKLYYLEFKKDSLILAPAFKSFTYFQLNHDTISIKEKFYSLKKSKWDTITEFHNFKIRYVQDSIFLLFLPRDEKTDTFKRHWISFINIEKAKESVLEFKYIKLSCPNFKNGNLSVMIDSLGKVDYTITRSGAKSKSVKGILSKTDFLDFKNLLSRSLPSKISLQKLEGDYVGSVNFEIAIGANIYKAKSSILSWPHLQLLIYFLDISKNKNLIKL